LQAFFVLQRHFKYAPDSDYIPTSPVVHVQSCPDEPGIVFIIIVRGRESTML